MHLGHIFWLSLDEAFGYIGAPHQPDVYFRQSDLDHSLTWDDELMLRRVRFHIIGTEHGPRAVGVEPWAGSSCKPGKQLNRPSNLRPNLSDGLCPASTLADPTEPNLQPANRPRGNDGELTPCETQCGKAAATMEVRLVLGAVSGRSI